MGNFGSRKKKENENDAPDDVWLKSNDGKKSPKSKKKKKKKRKGKDNSPDGHEEDISQCDSYSYSTLSSRKLSDDTVASTGTITRQNVDDKMKYTTIVDKAIADDQSNGSIGYVTASDTFTPPSERKGRQSKFSPVIARNSPRVVRRLLQSDKIVSNETTAEDKSETLAHLSPRAKFFLTQTTPELSKNTAFETRKYSRHSSGSSIDSRTYLGVPESYKCKARGNDNRCITNGSLISKPNNQENKNNYGYSSRLSNNSLDMSDSTAENLVKTGEKAKFIRYDSGNMSPAERRKNKQNEMLRMETNKEKTCHPPFVKLELEQLKPEVNKSTLSKGTQSENKTLKTDTSSVKKAKVSGQSFLTAGKRTDVKNVPPPSPGSGIDILEVDESEFTENESNFEKHLRKDEEIFGDSVCKRLSLLLESEQDKSKLNRSEFHEFTDTSCSSPEIYEQPEYVCKEISFEENTDKKSNLGVPNLNKYRISDRPENLTRDYTIDEIPKLDNSVKTPQGKDNASVFDVMNNNFKQKLSDDVSNRITGEIDHRTKVQGSSFIEQPGYKKELKQEDKDIEQQMRHENEINEKLIEERIKTLNEIFYPHSETNKRSSVLFAVNNRHANDPDNYILVTKKTYCVKRGVLVELLDEEKDVIARDVIKTLNGNSDWVATGSGERYKPEAMVVEQGLNVVCPEVVGLYKKPALEGSDSEPDYVNLDELEGPCTDSELEDFERHERELDETPSSDEEIDFKNVLNRSQSQSDTGSSEARPKRDSDYLRDVISAYKDNSEYSDEVSDDEIFYCDEPRVGRHISTIVRTPSKLDKSISKLFQEKQLALNVSKSQESPDISDTDATPKADDFYNSQTGFYDSPFHKSSIRHNEVTPMTASFCNTQVQGYDPHFNKSSVSDMDVHTTASVFCNTQAGGYDSPHHKSSEGSRRSLTYTESDLDASEQWDDDDDASNDSMLADDEDDDDEFGEIIFSKPYKPYVEHEQMEGASFSYNSVKAMPESPVMWGPEPEDDEVFHDNAPLESIHYQQEDSMESSDEAFGDARKQMQEIHEQLQTLREQMVTFEKDKGDSSLPTSPLNDRMPSYPKHDSD